MADGCRTDFRQAKVGIADAVEVDRAINVVQHLVEHDLRQHGVLVAGAVGQAVQRAGQRAAAVDQVDQAQLSRGDGCRTIKAIVQHRRPCHAQQAESARRHKAVDEQLQRFLERGEPWRRGGGQAQRCLHEARQAVQGRPGRGAQRAQATGTAATAELDEFIHRARQLGLVHQRAQVTLALGFQDGIELPVGPQPARPEFAAERLRGHAVDLPQRVQHGVAARLQFRVRRLQQEASPRKAQVGHRLAHQHQHDGTGFVDAGGQVAEMPVQVGRQGAYQAREPGVLTELTAHGEGGVAPRRVQAVARRGDALIDGAANHGLPALQFRADVLGLAAGQQEAQVTADVVEGLLEIDIGRHRRRWRIGSQLGAAQERQAARLTVDALCARIALVSVGERSGDLLRIVGVAHAQLAADEVVQRGALAAGATGVCAGWREASREGVGIRRGHGAHLGWYEGVRPPTAAARGCGQR
mmetsp:Transcript_15041/g.35583  ORF Transcript_15041/g.35583 Transcript_15041/m.35583 type:complete len:469 (+) Transcript_15041:1178-2584(+)